MILMRKSYSLAQQVERENETLEGLGSSPGRRGVSRRTPGSPGFNVIFSSMVFPRVFLRKNYEKQVILTEKRCWASTLHISWLRPLGRIFFFLSHI